MQSHHPDLPHRVAAPPSPERYLDDLHSAPVVPIFERFTEEQRQLLLRRQLRLAGEARTDRAKFFEFVFREETIERARLKTAAHQKVVFDFIRHFRFCVIRLPTNFSKTYCMTADTLFCVGRNHGLRTAFISAAQSQAEKPLGAIRSYIETSPDLRLVFPTLRPSQREGEPWTQTAITVDRSAIIRDASVIAVGMDSTTLPGARLDKANLDDILSDDNTYTDDARKKTLRWIKSTVLQRFDGSSRCAFTNTPWHPEDATYQLERIGWPSLNMDCWGGIWFENADSFDSDELRPSRDAAQEEAETGKPAARCRLVAHDAPAFSDLAVARAADDRSVLPMEPRGSIEWLGDVDELVPLWPGRFPSAVLCQQKVEMGGGPEWTRSKEVRARADADARVQQAWIDGAKAKGCAAGYYAPLARWDGGNTFTGVDLAFSKKKKSDDVAIFSFAVLPDMRRLLLDIDVGKWKGQEVISRMKRHHDRFGSMTTVEGNAAQRLLREWTLADDIGFPIAHFETNKNKHNPDFGVESIFLELENGAWLIPSDPRGNVAPNVARWVSDLLDYRRGAHTGDVLMASWIAREKARMVGALKKGKDFWGTGNVGGGLGGITSR